MRCVACKESMIVLELEQIEIDYCLSCFGIWLDAGELELLVGHPLQANAILATSAIDGTSMRGIRKCPICRRRMNIVTVGSAKQVQIDLCSHNHGIWFDRGELEEIIAILGDNTQSKVADLLHNMFRVDKPKAGR
jgi:Zn-finger nucleic acid-binding protein